MYPAATRRVETSQMYATHKSLVKFSFVDAEDVERRPLTSLSFATYSKNMPPFSKGFQSFRK